MRMKEKEIKVLKVKPHEHPEVYMLKNTLEAMQEAVGGYIDIVGLDDNVCILLNDEGKLIGLEGNRRIGSDIIVGDFFVCGSDEEGNLTSLSEEEFEGKVSLVYPTIDAATHTFPVEVKLANTRQRIRPGMFGRVTVSFGTLRHVVVPDQAIVKRAGSGDRYVYVYKDGKVSYNKVELGRRMGTEYELISGVEDNSQVVVAGQTRLADGVEVAVN